MSKGANAFCIVCLMTGLVVPWGLLGASALISLFSDSVYWGETAAYMAAGGLILLALSYFWARLMNALSIHD